MVDPFGVEEGTAALYAVYFIVFFQEVLSEVGTVLAGYSGDERLFHFLHINNFLVFGWESII